MNKDFWFGACAATAVICLIFLIGSFILAANGYK